MKLIHLITAGMVVLALGACSKKENTTTSMEQGSQPAKETSAGAMEVPSKPEAAPAPSTGETAPQSGQPAPMQEPAGGEQKTQ
jgi:hypothetical protein